MLLFIYLRLIGYGFTICLWAILSLVIGYSSRVRYGFLLLEYALYQIKYWLGTPINSVPPYFADKKDCISKVLSLGWCPHFSFSRMQNNFLHERDQSVRVKAPVSTNSTFPCSVSCLDVVFNNVVSLSLFRETPFVLESALVVRRFPWDPWDLLGQQLN